MIYLISGSGEPNYGDDLIAYLWVKYYREHGYNGPIILDCKSIKGSIELHSELDESVYFAKHIKSLTTGRKGDVSFYIEEGREFAAKKFDTLTAMNSLGHVREFNLAGSKPSFIHLIGGGYINGSWPNSFAIFGALEQLNTHRKIPCFATGLGISPINKFNNCELDQIATIIKNNFEFFEVRDIDSYTDISRIKGYIPSLINGNDDTFLYPIADILNKKLESKKTLHISGFKKSFDTINLTEIIDNLILTEAIEEIDFWGCNKNDIEFYEQLKKDYPTINFVENQSLIYDGESIKSSDIMITSRFHPHLIGFRSGARGMYIAHSGFYNNKHRSIQALGSNFNNLKSSSSLSTEKNVFIENLLCDAKRILAFEILKYIL